MSLVVKSIALQHNLSDHIEQNEFNWAVRSQVQMKCIIKNNSNSFTLNKSINSKHIKELILVIRALSRSVVKKQQHMHISL